jgi:hypothetical protein
MRLPTASVRVRVVARLREVLQRFASGVKILAEQKSVHKRDETIRGHVFCSFLALLLKQELESA